MDFIKVLNKHVIFEYTDLTDSEFRAWIISMAVCAMMEKEPTPQQLYPYVHHKTLTSLQDKLKTRSITLQDILKKVLIDVQEVVKKRESWKQKQKEKRARLQNVSGDVPGDVSPKRREEKRREEKNINNPPLPPRKKQVRNEGFDAFYSAYPKKKSRGQAEKAFSTLNPDEQLLRTMLDAIERAKTSEEWTKENGRYIPYPATWLNAKGWLDESTEVDPWKKMLSSNS